MTPRRAFAVALSLLSPLPALAAAGPHGHSHHGAAAPAAIGTPAPKGQGRVVRVEMTDNAFSLPKFEVKAGEVIRFVIVNKGSLLHEFNLNTAEEHVAHRPLMATMAEHGMITADKVKSLQMKMPDGSVVEHREPNSVLVEPGKSAEISWRFAQAGVLEIACNIPGHYEAGMVVPVTVKPH